MSRRPGQRAHRRGRSGLPEIHARPLPSPGSSGPAASPIWRAAPPRFRHGRRGNGTRPTWARTASPVPPATPQRVALPSVANPRAMGIPLPLLRYLSLRHRVRLDQRGVLVVDVPDSPVDRPYDHVIGGGGAEQRFHSLLVSRPLAEPSPPIFGCEDDRHSIMQFGYQLVRRGRDDRKAAHPLARRRAPRFPQAGERHQSLTGKPYGIGLPFFAELLVE